MRYHLHMQVRERLREVIDGLTDDEATTLLARIETELRGSAGFTPSERASIERGLAQLDRGEGVLEEDGDGEPRADGISCG